MAIKPSDVVSFIHKTEGEVRGLVMKVQEGMAVVMILIGIQVEKHTLPIESLTLVRSR